VIQASSAIIIVIIIIRISGILPLHPSSLMLKIHAPCLLIAEKDGVGVCFLVLLRLSALKEPKVVLLFLFVCGFDVGRRRR